MPAKKHILWLDAIRVAACFLVCLIHAPLPTDTSSRWLSCYNYLSSPCIGLFFMVSGALLFPVRLPLKNFVVRRLKRILIPLLFWSLTAVGIHYGLGQLSDEEALDLIFRIPFVPVEGVYWFMYTILGLYLFAPLLSPAIEKMAHARYMIVLWSITLCLPYFNAWLPGIWILRGDFYHSLSEFGGYMGYMVLGYYLRHASLSWKTLFKYFYLPGALLILGIPAFFINGRCAHVTNEMLYGYLTINVATLCVIYFTLIQKIGTISSSSFVSRGEGYILHSLEKITWRFIPKILRHLFGTHFHDASVPLAFVARIWPYQKLRCANSANGDANICPFLCVCQTSFIDSRF